MAKTDRFSIRPSAVWLATLGCLVLSGTAAADTRQVLDRVAGFSPSGARQMAFDVPPQERTQDSIQYFATPRSATGFVACQLTGRGGLACLDGREVRYWPNAAKSPETSEMLFSCEDPALGLDTKRGVQTCTGLAVDLSGAVWISGKKPNNSYSLIKAVPVIPEDLRATPSAACPNGTTPLTGGKYCRINDEFASGRPLLQEITAIDGDLGAEFKYGNGVAGVELRSSIVYFTDPKTSPQVIASGKSTLGLNGNEQVLSAALLRLESGTFVFLYVTSTGRVLAINDDKKTWVPIFGMQPDRTSSMPPATCPATSDEDFAIATSSKSGRVYVSDRRFCRIVALEVRPATNAYGFVLGNATEVGASGTRELTLSTGGLNPDSVSVAPGIVLNLADCVGECDYVSGREGEAAATLRFVRLQNTGSTNMTVFQITGIPDCRYIPDDSRCIGKGAVVNPNDPIALQRLDVTRLLPKEVTDLFAADELPSMLITERYRGQAPAYEFDAFFGLPEAGVEFRDVFEGEFAVNLLAEKSLGCIDPMPGATVALETLLRWDVTTTVSERFVTYGNKDVGHQDTIVNSGCGSTKVTGSRWSLYAYNLEMNPDTISYVGDTRYLNTADDAVFAKLVDQLYDDLYDVQTYQVCDVPPEGDVAPVSGSICGTLASNWANGRDKLTKCIGASTQPKQSSGDQNCSAFRSQLTNYRSTIEAIPAALPGSDIANRIGELKARARIVEYLFVYRFLPSIPPAGFCESPGTAPNFTCGMEPLSATP
jgi:hypothetical protein